MTPDKPCTHEHTRTEVIEEATCSKDGLGKVVCADCEEVIEEQKLPIDPENHDWVLESDTSTCTEDGVKTYKCIHCDETREEVSHHVDYETSGYCETCGEYKFENYFTVKVYTSLDEFIADTNFSPELSINNENNTPYDVCKFSFESENPSMTVDTLIHQKLRYLNYSVIAFMRKGFPTATFSIGNEESINEIYSIYVEPQTN